MNSSYKKDLLEIVTRARAREVANVYRDESYVSSIILVFTRSAVGDRIMCRSDNTTTRRRSTRMGVTINRRRRAETENNAISRELYT